MSFRNIRQIAYITRPELFDGTIDFWQKALGVGPFWLGEVQPANQIYRGQPTNAKAEVAMGFLGNVQIELIRPLNDEPSVWNEALEGDPVIPPAGLFHHFLIDTDEYDSIYDTLLDNGLEQGWDAELATNRRVAYLDGLSTFGHYVEVADYREFSDVAIERMKRETVEWDGVTDPRRSYSDVQSDAQKSVEAKG